MGGHDAELILIAGALLAAGIAGALLADRVRIPGLLLFLGLGMLAGSEGIGGIDFNDAELARTLGTIALVLILFEGGLTAGWAEIRPVLGTAASLATVGTVVTAVIAGLAAKLDLRPQHARRDAGRRGDRRHRLGGDLRRAAPLDPGEAPRPLARGRVGDERPGRAAAGHRLHRMDPAARLRARSTWPGCWRSNWRSGIAIGVALGRLAVAALDRVRLPTDGIYPVATIAIAGARLRPRRGRPRLRLPRRLPDRAGARLGRIPARRTIVAFHQGFGWVAQIALFILLGLLVFPSTLGDVAVEGAGALGGADLRRPPARRLRRHRSSRRSTCASGRCSAGPACAARPRSGSPPSRSSPGSAPARSCSSIVFFVVVTSTLIQGASFEPLASRLGLTTDEPALPRRLIESGLIRRMGGDVVAYRLRPGAAAAGHLVRELGLPREALVNVIVRDGTAIPPRGSTEIARATSSTSSSAASCARRSRS